LGRRATISTSRRFATTTLARLRSAASLSAMQQCCAGWFDSRQVPQEVIRILKKDVLPFFKERDTRTITSREINDRLDAIVARGAPVMANRTAPIISQMFSFGVHRSIVSSNLVSLIFKPGGKERSCDRVLTETECHAFLHGASVVCISPVQYHTARCCSHRTISPAAQ